MKTLFTIGFLLFITVAYAENSLIIEGGNKVVYKEDLRQIIECSNEPITRPDGAPLETGDLWRRIDTNDLSRWNGTIWKQINVSADADNSRIKAILANTKAILDGPNPDSSANVLKRLKNAEKILYLLYKNEEPN